MKTVKIPDGYPQLMPYLILSGAVAFIKFAQNVFGAVEKLKVMRDENTIMHAEVTIGMSVVMVADVTDQYTVQPAGLFLYVDDCDSVYQRATDQGSTTLSAPTDQSYGRSAGFKDPFGNTWWITSL